MTSGHPIANALVCVRLFKSLAAAREVGSEQAAIMLKNAAHFESLALGVLDFCHIESAEQTTRLLRAQVDHVRLVRVW